MQDSLYWILNNVPTIENRTITGCRLPTARQILFCFLDFHRIHYENKQKTVTEALNATLDQVFPFYQRAKIPTLPPKNSLDTSNMDLLRVPKGLDSWEADRISNIDICAAAFKQGFVRGDYKELVQLAQIYHSDTAPVEKVTKLIRPGACHRACWMDKIIYACKVVFLSDSDKRANTKILRRGQLPKVERFLRYVMYVYLSWWLTAPIASGSIC